MKTKTITLPHLELLVVELPEGAIDPTVTMGYITARVPNHTDCVHDDWVKKLDVDGDWKHLGAVSDVAEEQAAGLVDAYEVSHNLDLTVTYAFKDYVNGTAEENNVDWDYLDEYPFDTALESLHSLLEANGVVFENKCEYPSFIDPKYYDEPYDGTGFYQEIYSSDLSDWQEAQKQVWDKDRTHLFIKQK